MESIFHEDIASRILELLELEGSKMVNQISDSLQLSEAKCRNCLEKLVSEGKVFQYPAKRSGHIYYAIKRDGITADEYSHLWTIFVKEEINVRDACLCLEHKAQKIDDNVTEIYVNLISIMSIFVAIFSLIVVNANIVFELTQQNMKEVFCGIILINMFVVICIIVLLLAVRFIIVNSLIKRKTK